MYYILNNSRTFLILIALNFQEFQENVIGENKKLFIFSYFLNISETLKVNTICVFGNEVVKCSGFPK